MYLMPVNELKSPRMVRERLAQEEEILLTNNGRPMAILVNIQDDADPEEMLVATREARSQLALRRVRESARRAGTADMSSKDIDKLIADVRKK